MASDLEVTVPSGVKSGNTFTFFYNGTNYSTEVPMGHKPGDTIHVQVPPQTPPPRILVFLHFLFFICASILMFAFGILGVCGQHPFDRIDKGMNILTTVLSAIGLFIMVFLAYKKLYVSSVVCDLVISALMTLYIGSLLTLPDR